MTKLAMENVCYKYKNASSEAVKEVNCNFEEGKLYAIMGPSGSGKSTLLSMLSGLDKPTGGKIFYDKEDINTLNLDQYRREKLSMIFQSFHLLPLLTVMENVCYPMELNGINTKEAATVASKLLLNVGITDEQMSRFPSNLSGGEQQRVAIARSLASGAKVLLADEPTGNLDLANTDNIMMILKKLAHEKKYCVIVVTHDKEVADLSDVMYNMKDGELLLQELTK